jgi:hypothetical protein
MMNKLEKTVVGGCSGIGRKFIGKVGSKRQALPGICSRVFRCVTVKTSLLIQICKTIPVDASNGGFYFKSSQEGNSHKIISLSFNAL